VGLPPGSRHKGEESEREGDENKAAAARASGQLNFLLVELSYFSFSFVEVGLLISIQFRAEPEPTLRDYRLTSADSGLQLDLEIALNGLSPKIQPLRLIQPCRRCVETSNDEIEGIFISTPESRIWDFSPMRLGAAKMVIVSPLR
jgi:hypothetical protein